MVRSTTSGPKPSRSRARPISAAAIRTAGLLGDQFVAIEPGAEEELLRGGESLDFTESALSLDKLIGSVVHDTGLGDDE